MKLWGELISGSAVTAAQRKAMFALMERYYQNVSEAAFMADLAEKQWAIMLSDPHTNELCGFSTQTVLRFDAEGGSVTALFSGDTIIAPEHWGDVALAHVWGQLALSLMDQYASVPLYWFLISKGYKTYRFLPLFFHEFYPRYGMATPPWAQILIDSLGRHKFPSTYDPRSGVVRATATKEHLRPGVAEVTESRLHDPHVRFFIQRNPGHALGDELCCVTPLTRANFTPAAWRVIGAKPSVVEAV